MGRKRVFETIVNSFLGNRKLKRDENKNTEQNCGECYYPHIRFLALIKRKVEAIEQKCLLKMLSKLTEVIWLCKVDVKIKCNQLQGRKRKTWKRSVKVIVRE